MKKAILLVVSLFLLTACSSELTPEQAMQATAYYQSAMDTRATAESRAVTAMAAARTATPQAAATATAQAEAAMGATVVAFNLQSIQIEATAQAAQATADAFRAYGQATSAAATQHVIQTTQAAQATATERAWIMAQMTAQAQSAQATSTAETARLLQQWTATAQANATANAQAQATASYIHTATAQAPHQEAVATMSVLSARNLELDTEREELSVERDRLVNKFAAWLPIGLAAGFALFVAWLAWRLVMRFFNRPQAITRDAYGNAPILIGNSYIYDPERAFSPAFIAPNGRTPAAMPLLAPDVAAQAATTDRAQRVNLAQKFALLRTDTQRQAAFAAMQPAQIVKAPEIEINVLPPDDPRISAVVQDVETQLARTL